MKVYNSFTTEYWLVVKLVMKPLAYHAYKEAIR